MRRGKKTSIPASSVVPALRPRPDAKEPEAPPKGQTPSPEEPLERSLSASPEVPPKSREASSAAGSPAAGADPLCEPARFPGPLPRSGSPSALGPESSEAQEPLPLVPHRIDIGRCARGLAVEAGRMLNIFRSIPTQMDYKGQKLAEQIFQGIILVSAVIGFIYGYITEQFGWTVYIVMAGFALSCLLTLPPWPIYRRNPLKWLPVQELATDDKKPADRKVKRHSKN